MNSSWVKILLTVLILAGLFSDIQARFGNELHPFWNNGYKISPRRFWKFGFPRISKQRPSYKVLSSALKVISSSQKVKSSTKSVTSDLCAGMCVEKCAARYPKKIKQCKICGLINLEGSASTNLSGHVVKPPYKYPWQVAVITDKMITCGATIISDSYILTAGHCFHKDSEKDIFVGFVTKSHHIELGPKVEKVIVHPEYTYKIPFTQDFALLKLKKKLTCGKYKNPICLPSSELGPNSINRTVLLYTGWGTIGETKKYEKPGSLMEGTAKIDFSQCEENRYISDYEYCIVRTGNSSLCYGDSGGSMFYIHNKKYYVMGVCSRSTHAACSPAIPFIYAKVSKVVQWIKTISGLNE